MSGASITRIDLTPELQSALERDTLVLVPNNRLRDALLAAYAQTQSDNVFRTPRVYAIDIWIQEFWDLCAHSGIVPCCEWQLLTAAQELFLWTTIIESSLADIPLLNPEETALAASQSYRELRQWIGQEPGAALRSYSGIPDVAAFAQWLREYNQQCQQRQSLSLVDAIDKLLSTGLDQDALSRLLPPEIYLVNFFQPPPLYLRLFEQLGAQASVTRLAVSGNLEPAKALRQTFSTGTAELIACAHWARALQQEEPGAHIGIICAEDFLGQPALRQLFATALAATPLSVSIDGPPPFNTSNLRASLLDAPLIHDAFLLLNLGREQQQSDDLSRLLQSPYVLGQDSEREARLQMEQYLRRYGTAHTTLTDFCWRLNAADRPTHAPLLGTAILAVRTALRQYTATATAREWSQRFQHLLTTLGWPAQCGSDSEQALLHRWRELLDTFARCSAVLGPLSHSAAVARLRGLCQQQGQARPFDPTLPLSIYTVTEAVGLRFDHVWLFGFSDQSWPPPARPMAFLPYRLQLDAKMPGSHSDVQFARAQEQFELLRGSVSGCFIANYHSSDGELELSPSSFLLQLPEQAPDNPELSPAALLQDNAVPVPLTRIEDTEFLPLTADETVRGGQGIISNQASCPFRAFTLHRLRADALPAFETGLSNMARGSALHAALETLFTTIDSRAALEALTPSARDALVTQASATAIDYLSRNYRELMTPRFRELEQSRIATLLARYLALEEERPDYTVLGREQVHAWSHNTLNLELKIDRIDRLADNSLALIDYKTGKRVVKAASWIESRPEDMQLPLYYTVVHASQPQPVSAVMIANVNVERIGYSGLAASEGFHDSITPVTAEGPVGRDWDTLTRTWQMTVEELADEFTGGRADVAPVNGRRTCEYCKLKPLCRIQELDQSDPYDDSGEDAV